MFLYSEIYKHSKTWFLASISLKEEGGGIHPNLVNFWLYFAKSP